MKSILLLFLAAFTITAADRCSLHGTPAAYVRKGSAAGVTKLDPLSWTRADNIIRYLTTVAAAPASEFCEYHKAFDRWVAWRKAPRARRAGGIRTVTRA